MKPAEQWEFVLSTAMIVGGAALIGYLICLATHAGAP